MILSIADFVTIIDRISYAVKSKDVRAAAKSRLEVREALKSFYFSDGSIGALQELAFHPDPKTAEQLIGQLALRQRDSQESVSKARRVLEDFSFKDSLSVKGRQYVRLLLSGKMELREGLQSALFRAVKLEEYDEFVSLLEAARKLNSNIIELDESLGNILLD